MTQTAAAPDHCSFCGKSQHEVRGLIEGSCSRRARQGPHAPGSCVFICDECVEYCAQVFAETLAGAKDAHPH